MWHACFGFDVYRQWALLIIRFVLFCQNGPNIYFLTTERNLWILLISKSKVLHCKIMLLTFLLDDSVWMSVLFWLMF